MVATIGPLVKVAKVRWATSMLLFVTASTMSAMTLGLLLGLVGSLFSHGPSTPSVIVGVFALACALVEVRALPVTVPFCARSVPQSWWRRYGPVYGSVAYGAVLGIGVTTVIPFITFYFVLFAALLAGPIGGGLLLGLYGFARSLPVLIGSAAIALGLDIERVVMWVNDKQRTARVACAAALVLVAAVLLTSSISTGRTG